MNSAPIIQNTGSVSATSAAAAAITGTFQRRIHRTSGSYNRINGPVRGCVSSGRIFPPNNRRKNPCNRFSVEPNASGRRMSNRRNAGSSVSVSCGEAVSSVKAKSNVLETAFFASRVWRWRM